MRQTEDRQRDRTRYEKMRSYRRNRLRWSDEDERPSVTAREHAPRHSVGQFLRITVASDGKQCFSNASHVGRKAR